MSVIEMLLSKHPIRKSAAQKASFHTWMTAQAQEMGYAAQVEKPGGNHNIIIGDPEAAQVVFTAHYDTPASMFVPNIIFPKNRLMFLITQIGSVLMMLAVSGLLSAGAWMTGGADASEFVFKASLIAQALLMLFGPANKNNANDNTSGVAAVMEIMLRLPEAAREKAAFILFDNEEKGLLGSGAYARKHKTIKQEKLIINLDCVGDGEHILFFANERTRALPVYPALCAAMEAQTGRHFLMNELEDSIYPSDQKHFRYGIAVCACQKSEHFGYFCDKIHTAKDTICQQVNLDFIADGLAQFVAGL